MAVNTDLQSLQQTTADVTVHIGSGVTRGLGSGSDPELGYRAAFEEQDKIKRLLKGSDMVFVTAGAGGGTGTGAAPVIARLARDVGALTVGIVTKPFGFEGTRRAKQAEDGIEALGAEVDTLIVVPNERLLSVLARNTTMVEAFQVADDVLRQGVQGISELITLPGLINLDFADVRTTMRDAGQALLGIGMGTGDTRAVSAAERAVSSPLLETSVDGARSILLSITGGPDLSLLEVSEAARVVQEAAHPDANIIFGANVDESLDEQIWVTVIATRFDARGRRADGSAPRRARAAGPGARRPPAGRPPGREAPRVEARPRDLASTCPSSSPAAERSTPTGCAAMSRAGAVAAGHPLTAEAGRAVLREGGNAVDAAVAAVMTSFVTESPLTGLGAGGYMLVHAPDEDGAARLLRRRPGTRRASARSELVPIPVYFSRDVPQVFNIGAASCGVPGTAERALARRCGGSARCRSRTWLVRRWATRATASGERRAGVPLRDPGADPRPRARGAGDLRAAGPDRSREGDVFRFQELADALERSGPRARSLLPRRGRAAISEWVRRARRDPGRARTSPPTRRSRASPCAARFRGREVLTNPPPSSGGLLIAFALDLLDRLGAAGVEEIVAVMEEAQAARTAEFLAGLYEEGLPEPFLDPARSTRRPAPLAPRPRRRRRPADRLGSTTHITAVDGAGGCASVTCSNGTGSGLFVHGTGVHVNNMLGEEDLNPFGFHRHRRAAPALDDVPDGRPPRRRARARPRQRRLQPDPLGDHPDDRPDARRGARRRRRRSRPRASTSRPGPYTPSPGSTRPRSSASRSAATRSSAGGAQPLLRRRPRRHARPGRPASSAAAATRGAAARSPWHESSRAAASPSATLPPGQGPDLSRQVHTQLPRLRR